MANNFVFNDSLPVAPLKLAALDMMWIPICWTATARALALARQKA